MKTLRSVRGGGMPGGAKLGRPARPGGRDTTIILVQPDNVTNRRKIGLVEKHLGDTAPVQSNSVQISSTAIGDYDGGAHNSKVVMKFERQVSVKTGYRCLLVLNQGSNSQESLLDGLSITVSSGGILRMFQNVRIRFITNDFTFENATWNNIDSQNGITIDQDFMLVYKHAQLICDSVLNGANHQAYGSLKAISFYMPGNKIIGFGTVPEISFYGIVIDTLWGSLAGNTCSNSGGSAQRYIENFERTASHIYKTPQCAIISKVSA